MFWLKIIQRFEGYKNNAHLRETPQIMVESLIIYMYSFGETYSFNKSSCLSCKREFFVDEILRNICLLLHMDIVSVYDIALH